MRIKSYIIATGHSLAEIERSVNHAIQQQNLQPLGGICLVGPQGGDPNPRYHQALVECDHTQV
jgi:hypothetical protein